MSKLFSMCLIACLLHFLPSIVNAQSFSLAIQNDTAYCNHFHDIDHAIALIKGNASDSISLDIIRTNFDISDSGNWINGMCVGSFCYTALVDSVRVKIGGQEELTFKSGFRPWHEGLERETIMVNYKFIDANEKHDAIFFNTFCVYTVDMVSSIANINDQELIIFPNPTTNSIAIDTPLKVYGAALYGMDGVQRKTNLEDMNIDLSMLIRGVYLLKIKTESGVIIRKIFKH